MVGCINNFGRVLETGFVKIVGVFIFIWFPLLCDFLKTLIIVFIENISGVVIVHGKEEFL